ncbi:MAG: hypothetical protein WCJ19_05120 [bacterium]
MESTNDDSVLDHKKQYINFSAIIAFLVLFGYALINIYLNDYNPALFEIFCALGFIIAAYMMNYRNKYEIGITIGNAIISILAVYNFITGGFSSTGIFWVFVLICVIFYINGIKSLFWVTALMVALLISTILSVFNLIYIPYSLFEIFMFFVSSIIISIFTFFYNKKINDSIQAINDKNIELNNTMKKLQEKNEELQMSYNDLNKTTQELDTANKLMIGRELRMVEIKQELEDIKGIK